MSLAQLRMDGPDIYWVEDNPRRQSRSVLLRRNALGQTLEVLPLLEGSRFIHVSTAVHGQGGRAYAVRDGVLVISDGVDNRVYSFRVSDRKRALVPLTPLSDDCYGDFEIDLERGVAYAIRENRAGVKDGKEPQNTLVAIPLDGSGARNMKLIKTVFSGTDFVSSPTISPDGSKLAWLTWNHPQMPWTESRLHVGDLDGEGRLFSDVVLVDHKDVATYEPRWTLTGDLVHVDDSTGWANLYRTEGFERRPGEPSDAWQSRLRTRALHPGPQAFSHPHWKLGLHSFDNLDDEHLVCSWAEQGEWHIGSIRLDNGLLEEWDIGWWPVGNVASSEGRIVFLGDSSEETPSIIEVENQKAALVRPSAEFELATDYISKAKQISWKTADDQVAYGLYYEPVNVDYTAPEGTAPPLLVNVNPVPTSAARPGMDFKVQYWTSRGFAVLVANVRGSTGRGRDYREALNGNFGVMDVSDCISGAQHLVNEGLVNPEQMAIRAESFGGLTVLHALEQSDVFTAGVSNSGAVNVKSFMSNAHKFQSRYPQRLMGAEDLEDPIWEERNPMTHLDKIDVPLLFLHGGRDELVPVHQVESAYEQLIEMGKPAALALYPDEGHLFMHNHSILESWQIELAFYGAAWGFKTDSPADIEVPNWGKNKQG